MIDDDLRRMEEEQAALRRVAMLVVRGAPPAEVFTAVAAETGRVLAADFTVMCRYRPDNTMIIVGTGKCKPGVVTPPVGSIWSLSADSLSARVARTGRPARMGYDNATEGIAYWAKTHGCRSGVGCPIVVEGRLWGTLNMVAAEPQIQRAGLEERMLGFLELAAAAIASAETRHELAASRARVVAAADATCRRIERDLHDGVQQRLIACSLQIRDAQAHVPPGSEELERRLALAGEYLTEVLGELREISHGLHPAALTAGGIGHALKTLARRSMIPVELDVQSDLSLPEAVEGALYYLVSEALTNATKHAHASAVRVSLSVRDSTVRVTIRDDGMGGAVFGGGSGLLGLKDRTEALGGLLEVISPPGAGTTVCAKVPIDGPGPGHLPDLPWPPGQGVSAEAGPAPASSGAAGARPHRRGRS